MTTIPNFFEKTIFLSVQGIFLRFSSWVWLRRPVPPLALERSRANNGSTHLRRSSSSSSRRSLSDFINHLPELSLALTLLKEHLVLDLEQRLDGFIGSGTNELSRLAHAVHDAPQILCLAVSIGTGRFGAEHGGTVADGGVDVAGNEDRHVAGGGDQGHQDVVLALRTGHEDGADLVARVVHRRNDLMRLQRDELHRSVVVQRQPIERLVAGQPNHRSRHGWVCNRRPVAEQIAVEEEVAPQIADRRRRGAFLHVLEVLVEEIVDVTRRRL